MTLFYDILIVLAIFITAIPAVILLYHRYRDENSWEKRHKTLSLLTSIFLLFCTFLVIYGSFIEPRFLVTNYQNVDISLDGNPIHALVVSDIHAGDYNTREELKKISERIVSLKPDVVFILGDNILADYKEDDRVDYLNELKIVADNIPTFAIFGNHDYGIGGDKEDLQKRYRLPNKSAEIKKTMEGIGIKFLVNQTVKLNINGSDFLLFGADEFLANKINFDSFVEMKKQYPDLPSIALIHNPAGVYLADTNGVDLVLSGHTHGGQVRLPFIGPVKHIEISIPNQWYQGLHQYKNTQLFVTSGVNESSARSRLFNPPEVVMMTIK